MWLTCFLWGSGRQSRETKLKTTHQLLTLPTDRVLEIIDWPWPRAQLWSRHSEGAKVPCVGRWGLPVVRRKAWWREGLIACSGGTPPRDTDREPGLRLHRAGGRIADDQLHGHKVRGNPCWSRAACREEWRSPAGGTLHRLLWRTPRRASPSGRFLEIPCHPLSAKYLSAPPHGQVHPVDIINIKLS